MNNHSFINKAPKAIFGYGANKIEPLRIKITKDDAGDISFAPLLTYAHHTVKEFIDGPDKKAMLISISEDMAKDGMSVLASVALLPYSTSLEVTVVTPGKEEIESVSVSQIDLDDRVFDLLSKETPEAELYDFIIKTTPALKGAEKGFYSNLELSTMIEFIKSGTPFTAYCDGKIHLFATPESVKALSLN